MNIQGIYTKHTAEQLMWDAITGKFCEACFDYGIQPILCALPSGMTRDSYLVAYSVNASKEYVRLIEGDDTAKLSEYIIFCENMIERYNDFSILNFEQND